MGFVALYDLASMRLITISQNTKTVFRVPWVRLKEIEKLVEKINGNQRNK
jgi:hypothetical protein